MIHDWLVSLLPGRPSNMNNLSCVILEEKSCNDLSFSRSLIIDAFRLVWADSPSKNSQNLEIIVRHVISLHHSESDISSRG
jgi:hypothetical protein